MFQNNINTKTNSTTSKDINRNYPTISLPLNTTYSCKNMCGPTARCSETGQQCSSDIDCPGCQPYSPPLSSETSKCIPGDNDSGKLTLAATPNYSSLTTDIGTKASLYVEDKLRSPVQANFGTNTWKMSFDKGNAMYKKRYDCQDYPYAMKYPKRSSLTGDFETEGPLPSNDYS